MWRVRRQKQVATGNDMNVHVPATVLAVIGAVCLRPFGIQEPKPMPVDGPESYLVYASLLPNEWVVRIAKAKHLVVQEETATNWQCMPSGKVLETSWKPVVDSFRTANESIRTIRAGQPLGLPYEVVPSRVISATFDKPIPNGVSDGWSGFYRKYPDSGGYLQVSSVGFDSARSRAMVYMAHLCGGLCGGGTHYLLEKIDGAWREANLDLIQCRWDS